MTDYFALLDQPRAPWLDPAALKEAYHRKTLQTHPDSATAGHENDFAELNAAYQTLQEPKQRLHHLLALLGGAPASTTQIPAELQELFLQIGGLNQRVTQLLEKMRAASNPLSRSLLKAEVVNAQTDVGVVRDKVKTLNDAASEQLQQINARQIGEMAALYQRFAYLGRWSEQLDEMAFQLSL